MDGFSEMHKHTVPCGSGSQPCSGRGWYRFSQFSGTHWWVWWVDTDSDSLVGSGSKVEVFGVAGLKSRKVMSFRLLLQPQNGSDCRGVWTIQSCLMISTGGDEWCVVRSQPWHFADSQWQSSIVDRWIKPVTLRWTMDSVDPFHCDGHEEWLVTPRQFVEPI